MVYIALAVFFVYVFVEAVRLHLLKDELEHPLASYMREWERLPGRVRRNRKRDVELRRLCYAYGRLDETELKGIRLQLTVRGGRLSYFQGAFELLTRFVLPVFTFMLGILVTTSNNLLAFVVNRPASTTGSESGSAGDLFGAVIGSLAPITTTVITLFFVALVHTWYRTAHRNKIAYHLHIVEQTIEDNSRRDAGQTQPATLAESPPSASP
ncbi:hypothetical protein [Paenibacillus flagellatus]|uniref:MotA/TolQ/ExbB proton channel domain-containing protein n=1 Tax=Paenibacillus flagellatus TaxID=2211139 RepID=A0A2V5KRK8_9BACL|nr:hypothetical protein [Paenibacillus flagellatus]PYI51506.1 hypothetical protein DLM86_24085 [Paenibacillus flagellatus]